MDRTTNNILSPVMKSKTSLTRKLFSVLPYWLLHQLSNHFLDNDLIILHEQEKSLGTFTNVCSN
jgi:Pheophorbide a oxygenase